MSARATAYRTHTCGELRGADQKSRAKLCGRVDRLIPGGKGFLIRDAAGVTVIALAQKVSDAVREAVTALQPGDIVEVTGAVVALPKAREDLATGEIAVVPLEVTRHAVAGPRPEGFADAPRGSRERLTHRHLDLQSPALQERLRLRSQLALAARGWLADHGFVEVETPALGRMSPDAAAAGALVVSQGPGRVFALPAAQREHALLLGACGFERAYELGRRARRGVAVDALHQPEYTTLDLALAFVDEIGVQEVGRGLVQHLAREVGAAVPERAVRLTFSEALRSYGADAPDLRFGAELADVRDAARSTAEAFPGAAEPGGGVFAVAVAGAAGAISDAELDRLAAAATADTPATVRWARIERGRFAGPHAAGVPEHTQDLLRRAAGAVRETDLIVIASANAWTEAARAAGRIRVALASAFGWLDPSRRALAWVEELPLFEPDRQGELRLARSPLVRIQSGSPGPIQRRDGGRAATTHAFRLALDGVGVGSGALWYDDPHSVRAACRMLGMTNTETESAYGPLLQAMRFGMPPTGTLSIGFDRLAALLVGATGIDEVMAFPKAADGSDPLSGAPSPIEPELVRDLIEPF